MTFLGLGFLTDLMNWVVTNPEKGVVVILIANPLTMTIVAGLVFEGRMVKIWHGQSRSFFPGDLFLAIAAIMAVVANSRMVASDLPEAFMDFWENKGAIIAFFIALIVLWLMRKVYDAQHTVERPVLQLTRRPSGHTTFLATGGTCYF